MSNLDGLFASCVTRAAKTRAPAQLRMSNPPARTQTVSRDVPQDVASIQCKSLGIKEAVASQSVADWSWETSKYKSRNGQFWLLRLTGRPLVSESTMHSHLDLLFAAVVALTTAAPVTEIDPSLPVLPGLSYGTPGAVRVDDDFVVVCADIVFQVYICTNAYWEGTCYTVAAAKDWDGKCIDMTTVGDGQWKSFADRSL